MSYAIQPPVATPSSAVPEPRRPAPVTLAAVVLTVMAVVGLAYAIATVSTAPGTVSRFRAAATGAASADVDGYVSVIWIGAAIGTVLAVILVALFVVLALGLRRGSNAARIATWVVCGLGLLAGLASTITVLVQRSGDANPQSLGAALTDSYPNSWIGLNLSLTIAQMIGYLVVALLLLAARGAWFGRGPKTPIPPQPGYGYGPYSAAQGPAGAPGYGYPPAGAQAHPAAQGYGPPPTGAQGYGPPPIGAQGYGPPSTGTQGYPAAPGYGAPGQGGAPSTQGYAAPNTNPAQSYDPSTQSYGPGGPGYSYGTPYDQSQSAPPGQAFQPGAGSEWSQESGPNDRPATGGQQSSVPPFGMPVVNSTGDSATGPTETPRPGPDDEFWSRPSS